MIDVYCPSSLQLSGLLLFLCLSERNGSMSGGERERKNTCEYTAQIINLPRRCLACLVSKISKIRRRERVKKRQTGVAPDSSKLQMCRSVHECFTHSCQQRRERHKGPLCSRLKTGQERELKIYSRTSAVLRVNRSFPPG